MMPPDKQKPGEDAKRRSASRLDGPLDLTRVKLEPVDPETQAHHRRQETLAGLGLAAALKK
jgi:hypothetical protein